MNSIVYFLFPLFFKWIRQYPDGTSQYIEGEHVNEFWFCVVRILINICFSCFVSGATNPDYVVTADDVDTIVSVECIPMDELGRQVMIQ